MIPLHSKIFERAIVKRFYKFFINNNILNKKQYGFIPQRSTTHAILNVINESLPAINDNKFCILVFLDFTKAFDCIDHNKLLDKLYHYGIRGSVNAFVKSYLTGRTQCVTLRDKCSNTLPITVGVPQGTSLAPFFYIAYANDLFNNIDLNLTMFADDTIITLTDSCPNQIINKLNTALNILSSWCNIDKIGINIAKSKGMIVTNRNINIDQQLTINSLPLEIVRCHTYLGIRFDNKLKYSDHIDFLKTKLSQLTGISRRITQYLDLHSAFLFYYSFIYSLISYGITCWGGILFAYKYSALHNSIDRIIKLLFQYHVPSYDPNTIHSELSLLKIKDIYKLNVTKYYLELKRDPNLNDVDFPTRTQNYNTRNVQELVIPFPRTNAIKGNFSYLIPRIWNEVPEDIRGSRTINIFKRKYREHLLKCYST